MGENVVEDVMKASQGRVRCHGAMRDGTMQTQDPEAPVEGSKTKARRFESRKQGSTEVEEEKLTRRKIMISACPPQCIDAYGIRVYI